MVGSHSDKKIEETVKASKKPEFYDPTDKSYNPTEDACWSSDQANQAKQMQITMQIFRGKKLKFSPRRDFPELCEHEILHWKTIKASF
uniref:Uncharacterized protein n=1 Tax=Romanomermis culicivorax TaxID=13658 RepID=A0A915HIT3_ROMCU